MDAAVTAIPVYGLVLVFVPAAIVIGIIYRWQAGAQTALYGTLRMLQLLLLIGYVLVYIFDTDRPAVIIAVLVFMLVVASWIAIRPFENRPDPVRNLTAGGSEVSDCGHDHVIRCFRHFDRAVSGAGESQSDAGHRI